jgi:DNA-directed RNA polymerase
MAFLQKLAAALAHEGKPLRWTTPAGLPWINRYHEPVMKLVNLTLNDNGVKTRQQINLAVGDNPAIAKSSVTNAVAPNFVHALDSSHLLLTVGACADEGIVDIATVHDSFGCLPSEADRFNEIIREVLIRMYTEHDVLAEIYASACADLDRTDYEHFPVAPPEYGTLNLEEIKNAKYAFS